MSKTHEAILGAVKTIRAVKDLIYKGKEIRGRRRERIDGQNGAYDIVTTDGETAEVDQEFAKEVVMDGRAEILAGGMCEVVAEKDGFHRYTDWRPQFKSGNPVYERVEYLTGGGMGGFLHWPAGFKCRMDISTLDRPQYCYEDEAPNQYHRIRVLKPSPKRVKMDAAEQSYKVSTMWKKLYPETPVSV